MKKLIAFALVLVLMLTAIPACFAEAADETVLTEGAEIRVMSWNVLSPDWLHFDKSKAPIDNRHEKMAALVLEYMPDVLALQESTSRWHKAFKPLLLDTGLYGITNRQCNAEGFKYCACPILYNPLTVKVVEEYLIDLDKHSDCRVFAVTVFEKLADGTRFVVTNTHPAPWDEPENYARNWATMTEKAAEVLAKYADLPVIMMGDYNTYEQMDEFPALLETLGVKNAKTEAETMLRNVSTYIGWQGKMADYERPTPYVLDHILINDKVSVKLYNVVVDHEADQASDHLPIYADIDLQ